ncbi:sugar ABC transporter substrate-binding protein [Agromyces aerolatus]|uniref:sugar ABC transporter substrate-binding protein n=1 Tax=Agromyces sp. LY-1074 TaxID=3074080 RepID=UPI00285AE5D2|nr:MULTISPECIES: substrate-binding domain-containing protein [unclassified Agromyces]MDR5699522.1 substrate-binding domain-containing protein [Agromyces sp. LY-1074]MDR5705818.1 substrate-binding domain-containing protein [Agromyces sp. LY-1358]
MANPSARVSRRRRQLAAAALAVAALALSGCRADGGATTEEDKASGEGLVIGWSQRGISGSDWWKTLVEGGEAEAEKIGARIELLDANGDTVRQNADIQTLITKGVDVVIMNANDPIGVGPSVDALKAAGIPLVTVNSNLDESLVADMFCYVAEDQGYTGSLAGEVAANRALEKFGDAGEMKVVGIGGFPGDVLSDLRFNGFMEGWERIMAEHAGVSTVKLETKYGEWKPDKALAPIRDVATANPDLKVVYSMSDVMNGGVVQGLQQAGLWGDGIILASYDGGMVSVKEMMDDPDGPLQATASNQPWDQGATAVKMALAAYNDDQSACPEGTLYIDTTVVTPENAADYYVAEDTYVRAQGE